jgi:hypothetical protein
MWHPEPKNDAWREVHLAHVESLGNRLWLSASDRLRQKHYKPEEIGSIRHPPFSATQDRWWGYKCDAVFNKNGDGL